MPADKLLCAALIGSGLALLPVGPAHSQWFSTGALPDPGRGPVHLAQTGEAAVRANRLEEQIRVLNGRIEDLNFQLLQMQEELRRMQEDNELRFQDLETKKGITGRNNRLARREEGVQPGKPEPSERESTAQGSDGDSISRAIENNGNIGEESDADEGGTGLEPQTLGTLKFDEKGNVVGSEIEKPIDLTRRGTGSITEVTPRESDLPTPGNGEIGEFPGNPDELYELGYGYVQAGEYDQAERVFNEFASQYPKDPRMAEARFWLGESLFAQGNYEDAARVFLDTHKQYPQGRMAPQTLLKLGVSLAGMDQRELACATFAEVPKKYPEISNAVKTTLESEQRAASCLVN